MRRDVCAQFLGTKNPHLYVIGLLIHHPASCLSTGSCLFGASLNFSGFSKMTSFGGGCVLGIPSQREKKETKQAKHFLGLMGWELPAGGLVKINLFPKQSMYSIFTYIYHILPLKTTKCR